MAALGVRPERSAKPGTSRVRFGNAGKPAFGRAPENRIGW
jgi:hypothetical protein